LKVIIVFIYFQELDVELEDTRVSQVVQELTEEQIREKTFNIYDVVLPLPGLDMKYPAYLREFYVTVLKAIGLDLDNMTHKIK
jgi:tRNA(Glu) U13 pseudouridine synthase TruD